MRLRIRPHPSIVVFAGLWLAAVLTLLAYGFRDQALFAVPYLLGILAFIYLTLRLTEPDQPPPSPVSLPVWLRWAQLGVVLLVILITGYTALANHGFAARVDFPLWTQLVTGIGRLGQRLFTPETVGDPYNALANPAKYFLIPGLLLLLLRARPGELGFGRGHRVWRVVAAWSAIPALAWAIGIATGGMRPASLLRRWVSHALQNGFFEEFLFRGALQTRLNGLIASPWALVVQALIFGLWHLGADMSLQDDHFIAGLATTVVSQAVTGLAYGVIFLRTRNLAASSLVHIILNSVG